MTKKLLVVITLSILLIASLATTVKAGGSTINELEDFFWKSHTICGKEYELTLEQKKAASNFLIPDDGNVTISDEEVYAALDNLNAAIDTLNKTGAKSLSEVPQDVMTKALGYVNKAGDEVGVSVNVNSENKTITVIDKKKGTVLGSSKYSNLSIGSTGSAETVGSVNTYKTLEGEDQTYNIANVRSLKFRFDVDYSYFKDGGKVYIDDKLVDAKNYTSQSGSTIIKLKYDYAKNLSLGKHTIKVEFNNGKTVTAKFKVTNTPLTTGNAAPAAQANVAGSTFVYTGSDANIAYITVSLLAVVAVSIAFVKKVYVK